MVACNNIQLNTNFERLMLAKKHVLWILGSGANCSLLVGALNLEIVSL